MEPSSGLLRNFTPNASKREQASYTSGTVIPICPKPLGSSLPLWYLKSAWSSVPQLCVNSIVAGCEKAHFTRSAASYEKCNSKGTIFIKYIITVGISDGLQYPMKYKLNLYSGKCSSWSNLIPRTFEYHLRDSLGSFTLNIVCCIINFEVVGLGSSR